MVEYFCRIMRVNKNGSGYEAQPTADFNTKFGKLGVIANNEQFAQKPDLSVVWIVITIGKRIMLF